MKKALVSFAYGEHEKYLKIALPSFYQYSLQHDYSMYLPSKKEIEDIASKFNIDYNRPFSWRKVFVLAYAIIELGYDLVLWVDADVVINKFDKDINQDLIENFDSFDQSFVVHETYEGLIPNCGIWSLTKNSIELLDLIWSMKQFTNHGWWEQRANMEAMQWNQYKTKQDNLTKYGQRSLVLPYEWNVHKNDRRFNESEYIQTGRFLHATMWPDRKEIMTLWSKQNA